MMFTATDQGACTERAAVEYELKFVISPERARWFLDAMQDRLLVEVYDAALPVAFTRTIYLDTPDRRYLRTSAAQVLRRLRLRQYAGAPAQGAPARFTGLCFLEYKESAAGQRRKVRLQVSPDALAGMMHDPQASLAAHPHADAGAAEVLLRELGGATLAPQLLTWYRRESMIDTEGLVRATIDTEIAFCPPIAPSAVWRVGTHGCGPARAMGRAPACLLEIKYDQAPPDWLVDAMRALGVPPAIRLSKYEMGMQILDCARRARHTRAERPTHAPRRQ